MTRTLLSLLICSLLLVSLTAAHPAVAQQPGSFSARMVFSFPGVFSLGGEADLAVTSRISVVASVQKWVAPGACLMDADLPSQAAALCAPCEFDGLSLGGGLRFRLLGHSASTPFLQVEAGHHRFETRSSSSPFLSFRVGYSWLTPSNSVIDLGVKHQWIREPVLGETWHASSALQLSAGLRVR